MKFQGQWSGADWVVGKPGPLMMKNKSNPHPRPKESVVHSVSRALLLSYCTRLVFNQNSTYIVY